jgi:hypothetical protein
MAFPPHKPSRSEAEKRIASVLGQYHRLRRTLHGNQRAGARKFDDHDIRRVLESGSVIAVEWDEEFENWEFVVSGRDVDGDELTLVIVIEDEPLTIAIITGK